MKRARYNSPSGEWVTPLEFHKRASSEYEKRGIFPYCPACKKKLHLYALHDELKRRFDHPDRNPNEDPMDSCAYSNSDSRFKVLRSEGWDHQRGRRLRSAFFEHENLKIAYSFCRNLTRKGNLPVRKFSELISRADRKSIWSYADIPLWAIPYILLILANFEQKPSQEKSGYKFHFVIDIENGTDVSGIWDENHHPVIRKVFSDGRNLGSQVNTTDNPYPISELAMKEKAGNVAWIEDSFLKLLLDCA